MSDGHGPTNADILKRLDDFAARAEKTEKRVTALEADREVVQRLHTRVGELGEKVTVIHQMLEHSEETVREALRVAARSIAADVVAGVRAEMGGMRDEVRDLRKAVESRPCLVHGETCTEVKGA